MYTQNSFRRLRVEFLLRSTLKTLVEYCYAYSTRRQTDGCAIACRSRGRGAVRACANRYEDAGFDIRLLMVLATLSLSFALLG